MGGELVGALGLIVLRELNRATPVDIDQVVDRFREDLAPAVEESRPHGQEPSTSRAGASVSGGPAGPKGTMIDTPSETQPGTAPPKGDGRLPTPPAFGVYRYATKGWEELDVIEGSRHDYPDETAITVSSDRCGWLEHWDSIEGRWDEEVLCEPERRLRVDGFRTKRTFYSYSEERTFACEPSAYEAPTANASRWRFSCTADGTTVTHELFFVGIETVRVGGVPVATAHVRSEVRFRGDDEGTASVDVWRTVETSTLVRRTSSAEVRVKTVAAGRTLYREQLDLRLHSLTPSR